VKYTLVPGAITCNTCGLTSHHPRDIMNRYCGRCNIFHDDPPSDEAIEAVHMYLCQRLSDEAVEAAHMYLRQRLARPPYPPNIYELARLIDRFYNVHYQE
jgi:hypothetical protein